MNFLPLGGLILGTVLRVLVPYVRSGLEQVAEAKSWRAWPPFYLGYLAMVLLPLVEYGVAFLTVSGLWETMFTWAFVPAVALGYTGTDLGKEMVQGAAAVIRMTRS